MAGRRVVYGGEDLNSKRKFKSSSHDQLFDSVRASASSIPLLVSGSRAMLSFGGNKPGTSFFRSFDQEDSVDDYLDEYFNQPEKKRRLSVEQIQFLERSFEAENKLEPERKIQLAKELGLRPRQIAVWFQNRRARWKSRQLETDYETLHTSYKNLKADFDDLLAENEKLRAEVLRLKFDRLSGDRDVESLQICDTKQPSHMMPTDVMSEEGESKAPQVVFKNEEQNSDTITNNRVCRRMDSIYYAPEFDESDSSHNGEDELNLELLQPAYNYFPRIEDAHCHTPESSFYYGFPVEDHHAFSFWSR